MASYKLTSRDPATGCETVYSVLVHLGPLGVALQSVHYEAGVWTITMDKDLPEIQRAHFENNRTQTVFTKEVAR